MTVKYETRHLSKNASNTILKNADLTFWFDQFDKTSINSNRQAGEL